MSRARRDDRPFADPRNVAVFTTVDGTVRSQLNLSQDGLVARRWRDRRDDDGSVTGVGGRLPDPLPPRRAWRQEVPNSGRGAAMRHLDASGCPDAAGYFGPPGQ